MAAANPADPATLAARSGWAKAVLAGGQRGRTLTLYWQAYDAKRAALGPDRPTTLGIRGGLGSMLTDAGRLTDAEGVLRDVVTIREKTTPAAWQTANVRSQLGAALLVQKKYAEAEPLLVAGYDGLKGQKPTPAGVKRLREALDRLIALAEATDRDRQTAGSLRKPSYWLPATISKIAVTCCQETS